MNIGIIITLPRHDSVTEYISQFSVEIIEAAYQKGIKIKELRDQKATKKEFETVVKNLDYRMIIFNGHGSDVSIEGHHDTLV